MKEMCCELSEVSIGQMSGPFTFAEAIEFFCGPFRTAPLGLAPKADGVGTSAWRMVQNLSFPDGYGVSVNDMIDSDDFPTLWGTAQLMADWVSWPLSLSGRLHCLSGPGCLSGSDLTYLVQNAYLAPIPPIWWWMPIWLCAHLSGRKWAAP